MRHYCNYISTVVALRWFAECTKQGYVQNSKTDDIPYLVSDLKGNDIRWKTRVRLHYELVTVTYRRCVYVNSAKQVIRQLMYFVFYSSGFDT